jgi:hypothetical protein
VDGNETQFTMMYEAADPENRNDVDILSFDTLGLRLTYWYYNYAIAQELEQFGGDCSKRGAGLVDIDNDGDGALGEDPVDGVDNDGDGRVDEDPSPFGDGVCDGPWRSTREWESGMERYPNEVGDINVDELVMAGVDCADNFVYLGALDRMDGLPDMVEIEIWVLDRERRERTPQRLTTRVQIPRRY